MTADILLIEPLMDHVIAALTRDYRASRLRQGGSRDALIAAHGPAIRAIATDGSTGCDQAFLSALPNLEIIACEAVGTDSIDLDTCVARGIRVTNTPGVLSDAVAELAMTLILGLCRRLLPSDRHVRTGQWRTDAYPLTNEFTGARVGILGLGRIGREIAVRCAAFKTDVSYHGRSCQADQPYRYYDDLVAMARDVDWLVIATPGGAATKHLVNREVLAAVGPSGSLVNVARGSVVDETALVEALRAGTLGGAALDVFADEPRVPDALLSLENVVLSPHAGSATHKTRQAMGDLVIANLAAHFAGKDLLTPVV